MRVRLTCVQGDKGDTLSQAVTLLKPAETLAFGPFG